SQKASFSFAEFKLVFALLLGRQDNKGVTIFLEGEEERRARKLLVRMLNAAEDEPVLPPGFLAMLASLFDTDVTVDPYGSVLPPSERVLQFKFRSKKRRADRLRNTRIATDIGFRVYGALPEGAEDERRNGHRVRGGTIRRLA